MFAGAFTAQDGGDSLEAHVGDAIAEAVGRVPPRDRDRVDRETGGKNPGALCARIEPQDVRREPDRPAVAVERLGAERKPNTWPLPHIPSNPEGCFRWWPLSVAPEVILLDPMAVGSQPKIFH